MLWTKRRQTICDRSHTMCSKRVDGSDYNSDSESSKKGDFAVYERLVQPGRHRVQKQRDKA